MNAPDTIPGTSLKTYQDPVKRRLEIHVRVSEPAMTRMHPIRQEQFLEGLRLLTEGLKPTKLPAPCDQREPAEEHEWVDISNTEKGGSIVSGAMCQRCGVLAGEEVLDGTS